MRKINQLFIVLLLLSCLCAGGCKEETEPQSTVIEGFLGEVLPSRKNAVVKGTFDGTVSGVKEFGFLYSRAEGLDPNDQTATKRSVIKEAFSIGKEYAVTLSDLEPGVEYYYCMYVSNGSAIRKTTKSKFKTLATSKPLLDKLVLGKAEEYSITASCGVLDNGGLEVMQWGFYYKKHADAKFEAKIAPAESFKQTLDKLSPGVTYDIFPYATNSDGTATGDTVQFTTQGFEAPVVKTFVSSAEMYGSDWVLLKGSVEKDGASAVKEMGFCYTTENREPIITDSHVSVTDKNKFEYKLAGLKPGTTYYVRAYARNETKIGYGEKVEFTTKTAQEPICEQPVADEITDTSFRVKATAQLGNSTITRMGFCYSAVGLPTIDNDKTVEAQVEGGALSASITGLKPETNYTVRAFLVTGTKTIYSKSSLHVRTTKNPIPVVGEITFTNIERNRFSANVKITSNVNITKQLFLYSATNKTPRRGGQDVKEVDFSYNSVTISEGILPNTLYYVCVYVINQADKEVYSEVKTVTTLPMAIPTIHNINVNREGLTANVNASYSSEGKVVECGICYSTTNKNPTVQDSKADASLGGYSIQGFIKELKPSTTYYIRVYAKNEGGVGYSTVQELKIDGNLPNIKKFTVSRSENVADVKASYSSEWPVNEVGVCYSASNQLPTINDTVVKGKVQDNEISIQVEGLNSDTTYWVRIYVKSSAGIGYSPALKIYRDVPGIDDNVSPDK